MSGASKRPFVSALSSTILAIVVVCSSGACGSNSDNPNQDNPDTTPGGELVGGELLEWDQLAPSADQARSYTYTLYVDGAKSGVLGAIRCDNDASPVGYRCSGELPTLPRGVRSLQVSASFNGQESPLSAALSVTVR